MCDGLRGTWKLPLETWSLNNYPFRHRLSPRWTISGTEKRSVQDAWGVQDTGAYT